MPSAKQKNMANWLMITVSVLLLVGVPLWFGVRYLAQPTVEPPPAAPSPLPEMAEITPRLARLLQKDLQATNQVPRTFEASLPSTLPELDNARTRKRLFVSTLLPIVLRANELILLRRGRILAMRDKLENQIALTSAEKQWLRNQAQKYRLKRRRNFRTLDMDILLYKVDVIPPSLALAQAAMETGWGTSRFAQTGNALFGEWVWGDDADGILPERREEGKNHKIKKFDHLLGSVTSYMTNLNRHPSYEDLRRRRAELRELNITVTGAALAPALVDYSERGADYVSDILSIINFNDLDGLDSARLVTQTS